MAVTGSLTVGFGHADITPPIGVPLAGFAARTAPSTGCHDPLQLHAVAAGSGHGAAPASIVLVADLVGIGLTDAAGIEAAIAVATGVPTSCISLAVTHTHGGPFGAQSLGGAPEPGYMELVRDAAVRAAQTASASRRSATAWVGTHRLPHVTFNRRSETNLDERIRVVAFRGPANALTGLVFSFACHPVVLGPDNTELTADWPGLARAALSERLGVPVIFLQGCCGDLNTGHRPEDSTLEKAGQMRTFLEAERIAALVVDAALRAVAAARPVGPAPVVARRVLVDLPSSEPALEQPVRGPVTLHDWSGARIVLLPGEPFIRIALDITEDAEAPDLIVGGYAGGVPGYVPYPPSVYAAGGYEVAHAHQFYGRRAAFAPDAGVALRSAAVGLLNRDHY
jgi:neutral ceramidase